MSQEMSELLGEVLAAHGGLERWSDVKTLTARLSLGGPFWAARAWPDVYADQTVTLDAQREHITFYSPDVTGSPRVAQYAHDPKTFDGFVFPTRCRVHRHDTDGIANQSFAAITVDIQSIAVGQT